MKENNWLFWLILLVIFTPLTFGMVVPIFVFVMIIKAVIKNANQNSVESIKNTIPRSRRQSSARRVRFNASDAELVDKKLKDYFERNEKLVILDEISLKPEKGAYSSIRELYLYMGNDCIASLEEFGGSYPEMYNDIMKMILKFARQSSAEPAASKIEPQTNGEKEKTMNAAAYIEKINQLNTEIANEEITNGLYQTSALLKHIAMIEEKFPDNRSKLNKLYQYYLPILVDILENYKNLDASARNHEDFKKSEERLIKTIILINEAMKTISASLCDEDFLNLSADMSTLEALLRKDGLVKEGTLESVRVKAGKEND